MPPASSELDEKARGPDTAVEMRSDVHGKEAEEASNAQKSKKPSYTSLFRFTTPFEHLLNAVGIVAAIAAGTAQPLMTLILGSLTSQFVEYSAAVKASGGASPAGAAEALAKLDSAVLLNVGLLIAIGGGTAVFTYISTATWIYTGESATRRIREKYFRAVLRQDIAFFDTLSAGELTTRIATDTHLIQEGISDKLPQTLFHLSSFVTGFVVALVTQWRLALPMASILPLLIAIAALLQISTAKKRGEMVNVTGRAGELVEEICSSIRVTHAFGTESRLAALFDETNSHRENLGVSIARISALCVSGFFFVNYCSYGMGFWWGTSLFLSGRASVGNVITVIFAVLIGAFSLVQVGPNIGSFASAVASSATIFETIDRQPSINSSDPSGARPEYIDGTLELDAVSFHYPSRPDVPVLRSLSAVFAKGTNTALVGASGSGKSSIIALLLRYYDPVQGCVKVDGLALPQMNLRSLRSRIGLVSQEPTLFHTTVVENIMHGLIGTRHETDSPEAKRERAVKAAKEANAHGFISQLPQGYDTLIGERGMLLSGGQRQRIAIARAIVSEPPILLLDEATSALDTQSEVVVQEALDRVSAGRTTVTVAHRLSTIKDAHQILVLAAGRVVERASTSEGISAHSQLLENAEGAYSNLVKAQRFQKEPISHPVIPIAMKGMKGDQDALLRRPSAQEALTEQAGMVSQRARRKQSSRALFLRTGRILQDKWYLYALGFALSAILGLVYPAYGVILAFYIDTFSNPDRLDVRRGGDRFALYVFVVGCVCYLVTFLQQLAFGTAAELLSRRVRLQVLSALMRQETAWHDRDENSSGVLTSDVSEWAQRINGLAGVTLGVILQNISTLAAGSVVALAFVWQLGLVGVACIPVLVGAGLVRLRVVVLKDVKLQKAHEASAQIACEAAAAIRTVAALTREEDCYDLYRVALDAPQRTTNRTALVSTSFYALSQGLRYFVMALVFWYGSKLLAQEKASTQGFFIAMICLVFAATDAGDVFTHVPDVSKARGAAKAIFSLLDSVPSIDSDSPTGRHLPTCEGDICFENVTFEYPTRPGVPVLRGLDLRIQPGQLVALVGPSGSGKSTVIQLLQRFYDPSAGSVTMDGHNVAHLNLASYRSNLALVSQEPTLFSGTIRFNVGLGVPSASGGATQEQVERACHEANIHDFIASLPDGYDTQVGGKGAQLSGGQKQRIAIARALVRNPQVLLLDEATSALDSESEKIVQAALDKAARSRTTVVVAHRLSSIQNADLIYVLDQGRVSEQGTHAELLAARGVYADLVRQQGLGKQE